MSIVLNFLDEKRKREQPIRYSHTEDVRVLFAIHVLQFGNPFNLQLETKDHDMQPQL